MGLKPRRSTTAFYSILEYTKEVLVSNKNNESQVSVQNLPNRPTKEADVSIVWLLSCSF
ncbi:hypothetical protein PCC7811_04409 [Planktothrix agardhii]|nr:hypothetical protein PCC7811_04409 [Planktothrix agardhii]